jgi:hypothetical protein
VEVEKHPEVVGSQRRSRSLIWEGKVSSYPALRSRRNLEEIERGEAKITEG